MSPAEIPDTWSRPTLDDVQEAARRIAGRVHRTPILSCADLDSMIGATVFFKCENLQRIGAFKARGAMNGLVPRRGGGQKRRGYALVG